MARHPRLVVPGVALHIRQRRVDGRACFAEESDYLVYLSNMRELAGKTGCAIHAYCLMTNHVHLLISPPDARSCASMMRDLGQRYVSYFNRRHTRSGTLWEGRFRSCLVESPRYVLECHRYIELNPVRARMVDAAAAYLWSSHRANVGEAVDPSLSEHEVLAAMAEERSDRLRAYRTFCGEAESEEFLAAVREATNGGFPLVGESLKAQLQANGSRVARGKPGPRTQSDEPDDGSNGEFEF